MRTRFFINAMKFCDKTVSLLNRTLSLFRRAHIRRQDCKTIGVIKLSAMGDALCLMPAVRELKNSIPDSRIVWLTTSRTNPLLFESLSFIDKIETISFGPVGIIKLFILLVFHRVDVAIDFDQYYRSSEFISFLWSRRNCLGFHTPLKGNLFAESVEYDNLRNEKLLFRDLVLTFTNRSAEQAGGFSVIISEMKSCAISSDAIRVYVNDVKHLKKPLIVICPGSSINAAFRRWSIDNFMSVAKYLTENGFAGVFLGGGDDSDLIDKINASIRDYPWFLNCINKLSLREALSIVKQADLLIGNDSGMIHLAELQGIPTIGIYGPNVAAKWGSLLPDSAAVEKDVPCRPCIKTYLARVPRKCKLGNPICLEQIQPGDIIAKIQEFFASTTGTPKTHKVPTQIAAIQAAQLQI